MISHIKISNKVLDFLTSNLKAEANIINFLLNLRKLKRATKPSTCFATLLQNELNSDVAQIRLLQDRFERSSIIVIEKGRCK